MRKSQAELLASRLLVYCYFPLIDKSKSSEAGSNVSSNSEESQSIASPRSSTEIPASGNTEKRQEQGWIWGWGSSEDFQEAVSDGEGQDQKPVSFTSRAGDLSRSWRARAAQAMSGSFYEAREEVKASSDSSEAVAGPSSAAVSVPSTRRLKTADCDQQRRLILFFLIQTFNRLPRSLHDLLLAKAPAVPPAYNKLRNPSQCAGNIERFLPAEDLSAGHQVKRTDSKFLEHADSSSRQRVIEDIKEDSLSRAGTKQERQAADYSPFERMHMLKTSMDALHSLGVFNELDQSTGQRSSFVVQQHEETSRKASARANSIGESHSVPNMGDQSEGCGNPFRDYLLSLLDGGQLAEAEDDSCLLLLSLLLHSVLRHPSVTEPAHPLAGCAHSVRFLFSLSSFVEAARSVLYPTAAQQRKPQDGGNTWEKADTLGSGGTMVSSRELVLVGAPITSGDLALRREADSPSGVHTLVKSGTLSWSFTAQLLDAIQTHLVNPFLRPITVRQGRHIYPLLRPSLAEARSLTLCSGPLPVLRVAISLIATLLTDHDEWETHRCGALDDLPLSRDARILDFPNDSRAGKNSTALPPYLLVAVTDQEVERRSVQLFLLFRRLHRDLSKILHSVTMRYEDVVSVAHEASTLLAGESPEPNPFESEDNAEQNAQAVDGLKVHHSLRYRTSHPLRNVECRLKKSSSRSLQLFVLDVAPPADGPLTQSSSPAAEKPPTMQ
ncbi:hypothetical protein Emag_001447 [Eimeria magna]